MRLLKAFLYSNLVAIPLTVVTYLGSAAAVAKYEVEFNEFTFDTKPTSIQDRDGERLANFYPDRRSVSMFEEIPQEIIDAFIASEDRDFFEHSGISVRGITRAALEIVKAGDIVQGGSTITQQFIKMSMLTSEKSYERKIKEIFYALQLEEEKSKEEIMELYLNQMEFKFGAFGIKDAMMTYFGINYEQFLELPKDEKVAISAMLAALVQNPHVFDPFKNPELVKKQRNEVLQGMYATDKIDSLVYNRAKNSELGVLAEPQRVFENEKIENNELVHYALNEAAKLLELTVDEVKSGGYDIKTSFDEDVYEIIRKEFENPENFPKNNGSGNGKVEASAIFISPLNGEIIAFTGGREEVGFMEFNRAFQLKKQPASTFKPIIAYGPALESGQFSPNSYLLDKAGHVFPGGYSPKNWDGGGRGQVTMKEAIRQSWNIPAVWTLQQVGVDYAKEYAAKLGLDLSNEPNYLTLALGGLETGVSPLQMADAYQVFATAGYRTPAHSVKYIADRKGKIIYKSKLNQENVVNTENAQLIKEMLTNAVQSGTGGGANFGSEVGGKTGTNGHGVRKGANGDYWFVGFDGDQMVGSVWLGFDKVVSDDYLSGSSSFASRLFKKMGEPISKIMRNYNIENEFKVVQKDDGEYIEKELPLIKLNGPESIDLEVGQEYIELGATAKDENFGDLTNLINISGFVDTTIPGEYLIKYQLLEGLDVIVEKVRKVTVIPPKMTVADYPRTLEYSKNGDVVTIHWAEFEEDGVEYLVFKNDTMISTTKELTFKDAILPGEAAVYQVIINKDGQTLLATTTVTISNEIVAPEQQPVGNITEPPLESEELETQPDLPVENVGADGVGGVPPSNATTPPPPTNLPVTNTSDEEAVVEDVSTNVESGETNP